MRKLPFQVGSNFERKQNVHWLKRISQKAGWLLIYPEPRREKILVRVEPCFGKRPSLARRKFPDALCTRRWPTD